MSLLRIRPASFARARHRTGSIILLTAVLLIMVLAMIAFALDVGVLTVARTELQNSADAAAMAAAWELMNQDTLGSVPNQQQSESGSRKIAEDYARANLVMGQNVSLAVEDISVGFMTNPADPACEMTPYGSRIPNAVRVLVRRAAGQNGEVPLFFSRALGRESAAVQAQATAALITDIDGFRAPSDGGNLDLLPIALPLDSWNGLLAGTGNDNWGYDPMTKSLAAGSDGIREIKLYPRDTGASGNHGTVKIGTKNNSTGFLGKQIRKGVTPEHLDFHGGELRFGSNGTLTLEGNPGISDGIKDDLASIVGKSRMIPLYSSVSGNGDTAVFTIVKFVGVRIVEVNMKGGDKRVIVQPAQVMSRGLIPGESSRSRYIYSPVSLVR